jgi:hypothetical protein
LVLRGLAWWCDSNIRIPHRDRMMMKSPTALVAAALVAAIILAMSCLIATGTRGEEAPPGTRAGSPPSPYHSIDKDRKVAPIRSTAF